MAPGWTPLVVALLGVIALAQVGILVVAALATRRFLAEVGSARAELAVSLARLDAAADEVGGLAAEARQTLQGARQAAAQLRAVVGSGRSLVSGALGAALGRRWLRSAAAGGALGASGGSTALRLGLEAATVVWRALAERRARRRRESGQDAGAPQAGHDGTRAAATGPAGGVGARPRLRAGPARRVAEPGAASAAARTAPAGGG